MGETSDSAVRGLTESGKSTLARTLRLTQPIHTMPVHKGPSFGDLKARRSKAINEVCLRIRRPFVNFECDKSHFGENLNWAMKEKIVLTPFTIYLKKINLGFVKLDDPLEGVTIYRLCKYAN